MLFHLHLSTKTKISLQKDSMKKPFNTLPAIIAIIVILGIVGYLNFYKPQRKTITTTASVSPAQKTTASPINTSQIGEKEAIEKVRQLPDVKKYQKDVPNAKILLDHEEPETNSWVIHVFEIKNGHSATFNWYTVDKITGRITAEFDIFSDQGE